MRPFTVRLEGSDAQHDTDREVLSILKELATLDPLIDDVSRLIERARKVL